MATLRNASRTNPGDAKSTRKPSTNLTLSRNAKRKAKQLKKALLRPSVVNLIEVLILEKYDAVFPKAETQNQTAKAA